MDNRIEVNDQYDTLSPVQCVIKLTTGAWLFTVSIKIDIFQSFLNSFHFRRLRSIVYCESTVK